LVNNNFNFKDNFPFGKPFRGIVMDSLNSTAPPPSEELSFMKLFEQQGNLQSLKSKKDLVSIMDCVTFISRITVAAMEAFQASELRKNDALVGENACQLRAAKIKDLADLYSTSVDWCEEIQRVKEQAGKIILTQKLPACMNHVEKIVTSKDFKDEYGLNLSVTKFCTKWGLLQPLSDNVRFIVESYWLSQTKKTIVDDTHSYQLVDKTSMEKLARFNLNENGLLPKSNVQLVSNKKLPELTLTIQRDLAALSVQYLLKEVRLLKDSPINRIAQTVLSDNHHIRKDPLGRECAPTFYSLESLMQRMIDKKQHLLIDITRWNHDEKMVDRLHLLYAPDQQAGTFRPLTQEENQPKSVVVIMGNSVRDDQDSLSKEDYLQLFRSHPLEEILNANWAQHAQYPAKIDQAIAEQQDKRRVELANRAIHLGCTPKNMSLFVVDHILCDTLQGALTNQEK
jgi:hypothetical protein